MATDESKPDRLARLPLAVLALIVPVVAVVAVLLTGPTWSATSATSSGGAVRIADFAFAPGELHVRVGAKVVVLNADSTSHTFSAKDGQFGTAALAPGHRATIIAPRTPGRYPFLCQIHPNMVGTMVVSAS